MFPAWISNRRAKIKISYVMISATANLLLSVLKTTASCLFSVWTVQTLLGLYYMGRKFVSP